MSTQTYIGSFAVNLYCLYIGLGALATIGWMLWEMRHQPWPVLSGALNGMLILAAASLIAGRLGYVLLHVDYFREHLAEVASLASPGLSEHAAILGGLVGLIIARRLHQGLPMSAVILLATLVGMGALLGCIPNGCAYGREVYWTDGWAWQVHVDWPDAYTINNPRFPVQLFLLAWLLVCLCTAGITMRPVRCRASCQLAGRLARGWKGYGPILLWIVLFAAGDFVLQFLRADPSPSFGPLRAQQWVDVAFTVLGSLWLMMKHIQRDRIM